MMMCNTRSSLLSSVFPAINRRLSTATAPHTPSDSYDVVVVGGGHNGLVAAAYTASAGLSTAVLERRHVLGGAAVTEEIISGYKFSRASYVLSLLRPQIFTDLQLKEHGLKVYLRDPSSYTPIRSDMWKPGQARSLTLGMCGKRNAEQIGQFSVADAAMYAKYEEELQQFVNAVDPLLDHAAINLQGLADASLLEKIQILRQNRHLLQAGRVVAPVAAKFYELMTAPTTKILDKWFESEPLKATLATDSCIGAMISPDTPGSGYVLLHHVMGELEGIRGAWGYPEGGMGAVSAAIARSAEARGAQIFTEHEVKEITVDKDGRTNGVLLANETHIKAKLVLSNATPEITFNRLLGEAGTAVLPTEFKSELARIDYKSPVCKINVALNRLPNFEADPNVGEVAMPHHRCTIHMNCESSRLITEAYQDAVGGRYSHTPMIEMTLPSSLDNTLAPPGHHVCLLFTQYAPYHLENATWDEQTKEDYANVVFDSIERYAPGFKSSIVGKEVLPPPDLERIFGLTGGNIFHGSMCLDQLYLARPTPTAGGVDGPPATPLANLLLCGSGGHPGGGVMGSPGRIAARKAVSQLGARWGFA